MNAWIFVADNKTSGALRCGVRNVETIFLNTYIGRVILQKNCSFKTAVAELLTGNYEIKHNRLEMRSISKGQIHQLQEKLLKERFNYTKPRQEENDGIFWANYNKILCLL